VASERNDRNRAREAPKGRVVNERRGRVRSSPSQPRTDGTWETVLDELSERNKMQKNIRRKKGNGLNLFNKANDKMGRRDGDQIERKEIQT